MIFKMLFNYLFLLFIIIFNNSQPEAVITINQKGSSGVGCGGGIGGKCLFDVVENFLIGVRI